ncbi:MAG: metal ABC transporter permease [Planctomycetes bacterium]|nr:metal ABC transporter permease [Planctomycetota bacterium]
MSEFLFWWELLREGFLASLAAAVVLPLVGALLFVRRSALLGIAVPQFSATGLALGLSLIPLFPHVQEVYLDHGHPPMLYSLLFSASAAGLALAGFAALSVRFRDLYQAIMAAGFSLALGMTVLLLNVSPASAQLADTLLRGEIILLDEHGMAALIAVNSLVLSGLIWKRRLLLLASFDREQTVAMGHSAHAAERWQVLLIGTAVGGGVITIGPMLVFALLFLPPLFGVRGQSGVTPFLKRTVCLSLVSISLSWPVSILLDVPFGPTACLCCLAVGLAWRMVTTAKS